MYLKPSPKSGPSSFNVHLEFLLTILMLWAHIGTPHINFKKRSVRTQKYNLL